MYTNFVGVKQRAMANQVTPFYIFLKIVAMRQAILKIKQGLALAYLSLDLIHDLKG
jgi:hypothetical protein